MMGNTRMISGRWLYIKGIELIETSRAMKSTNTKKKGKRTKPESKRGEDQGDVHRTSQPPQEKRSLSEAVTVVLYPNELYQQARSS